MPLWLDALGVTGIGVFTGYMFVFALRRLLPPINPNGRLGAIHLIALLASVGVTGAIGMKSATLPQGSLVGPYGVGLAVGLAANTILVRKAEIEKGRQER